jgi:transcriptional regulator with XRE-family HTH domain
MKAGRKPTSRETERRGQRMAEILRVHRNRRGLTQEALADRSGVSYATVRKIESGDTADPGFFNVADLARVLGIKLEELAGRPPGPAT